MRSPSLIRRILPRYLSSGPRHCWNHIIHRSRSSPPVTTCTTPIRAFSGIITPSDDNDPSSSSKHYDSQQQQQQQEQQHNKLHTDIPETNQAYQDRLEIRQTSVGWGLFAMRDFDVGDWVMSTHVLDMASQADRHTIQLDRHTHAHIDLPARLINHYCNQANVGVTMRSSLGDGDDDDDDGVVVAAETMTKAPMSNAMGEDKNNERNHTFDFYAIRPIQSQQELFFDYETTEFELSSPFDCSCGSPDCRGKLTGFRHHADQVMAAYQEQFIAPYLVEWFTDNRKK